MRSALVLVVLALVGLACAQAPSPPAVPVLNQICNLEFQWTYSCPPGGFNYSYTGAALFLSQQALKQNVPDLLYNGPGCSNPNSPSSGPNYLQAVVTVPGSSGIADVTSMNWSISNFTVNQLWYNPGLNFSAEALAIPGHTYVITHSDFGIYANVPSTNSIFLVTILSCDSNGRNCKGMYSVKFWSSSISKTVSSGFSSEAPSVPTCSAAAIEPRRAE